MNLRDECVISRSIALRVVATTVATQREEKMSATLTKVENLKSAISDAAKNEQALKCPFCERTYLLAYSDNDEGHWQKEWLKIAKTAMRKDHDSSHETPMISLTWHLQ